MQQRKMITKTKDTNRNSEPCLLKLYSKDRGNETKKNKKERNVKVNQRVSPEPDRTLRSALSLSLSKLI